MIRIDPLLISFLVGTLIPFVTGILTKLTAPRGIKALCTAVLSGVTAVVMAVQHAGGVIGWKQALLLFLTTEIAATSTYYGLTKPTGLAPALHESTGTFGVG